MLSHSIKFVIRSVINRDMKQNDQKFNKNNGSIKLT